MRQKKQLEEARKNGTMPPEKDKEGNLINPHIPEFMAKAPWYLKQGEGEGLKHQKHSSKSTDKLELDSWYKRGSQVTTKKNKIFKKGSCKNCGATTHDAKSCMERPRRVGAWKTGDEIAADEVFQKKMNLSYDESRDRWNGYDTREHIKTVKLFNKAEDEKRKQVLKERDEKFERDKQDDSESEKEEDILGLKSGGAAVKATVRNLRIREDTAKYLHNLGLNSAHYDPKTRSMRENPNPEINPSDADFGGDNFAKVTGDAIEMAKTQVFAWEASSHGNTGIHLQANPTQVALAKKLYEERAGKLQAQRKKDLSTKYGEAAGVQSRPDDALLLEGSSHYVEYSRNGRVLKGNDFVQGLSKYEEDVLEHNHTQIWGSYFDTVEMAWGFGCCASTNRNAYCTGEAGKEALRASRLFKMPEKQTIELKKRVSENPSPEAMEDYRSKKSRGGDPMANVTSDQILPLT